MLAVNAIECPHLQPTTLPRKSARRKGEGVFSQIELVNSGAKPRSGRDEVAFAVALGRLNSRRTAGGQSQKNQSRNPKVFHLTDKDEIEAVGIFLRKA